MAAQLVGDRRQIGGPRTDRGVRAGLGVQQRPDLVEQLFRGFGVGLRFLHQQRRGIDEPLQIRPGAVEREESLVDDLPQPGVRDAGQQAVGLVEQRADILRQLGAFHRDHAAVMQISAGASLGGTRSTYCSPTADTLRTQASTSAGIL